MRKRQIFALLALMIGAAGWSYAEEIVGAALEEPTAVNEEVSGTSGASGAAVAVSTPSALPVEVAVTVTTGPAAGNPAVSTPTASVAPSGTTPMVATSTGTAVSPVAPAVAIPVAVPVAVQTTSDAVVSWRTLEGTVQSVDRRNHILTVQDRDGKDIEVVMNDDIEIRRRGQAVAYADVEPNDDVVLRYQPDDERD